MHTKSVSNSNFLCKIHICMCNRKIYICDDHEHKAVFLNLSNPCILICSYQVPMQKMTVLCLVNLLFSKR